MAMSDTPRVRIEILADLHAYHCQEHVIIFQNGRRPAVRLSTGALAYIDDPYRFGPHDTATERRAFVRAFVAALTPTDN